MKAYIEPLKGKYYGTRVIVDFGRYSTGMDIWVPDGTPSIRELESWNMPELGRKLTMKDWDDNIEVDDGWGGKCKIQDANFLCDGHYESKTALGLAELIVSAINNKINA